MDTVIYDMNTMSAIKLTQGAPNLEYLKDNEDFMPITLWNEGGGSPIGTDEFGEYTL